MQPRALLAIFAAVVVALAAGAGGFLAGQATRDEDAARQEGLRRGLITGEAAAASREADARMEGASAARSEFEKGGIGYEPIYRAGRENGIKRGRELGVSDGFDSGQRAGQNSAFEGYDGGWSIGRWYLIEIGSGEDRGSSVKYSIPSRVGPLQYGTDYALCDEGDGICSGPG